MITSYLGRIAAGQDLSQQEMTEVIDQLLQGTVPEGEIAVLLTALRPRAKRPTRSPARPARCGGT